MLRLLLVALACLAAPAARADGAYAPFRHDAAAGRFVLDGPIDERAELSFQRITSRHPGVRTLDLRSGGGKVGPGLAIARRVRALGIATSVPRGASCFSACSFVFFAGVERAAEGRVGVHQLWSDTQDNAAIQATTAEILAALSGFGVPPEIVTQMLRTPAEDIHVLSDAELATLGAGAGIGGARGGSGVRARFITVESAAPAPRPAEPVAETDAAVRAAVERHFALWSAENDRAMAELPSTYGDAVRFYGEDRSSGDVAEEVGAFMRRWPERRYTLDPGKTRIDCPSEVSCAVSSEMVWYAHSAARSETSEGRAAVAYRMALEDGRWVIVEEGGRVLSQW